MAKLAPSDLAQVLSKLPRQSNENVIVGFDTADDAGVFRLSNAVALVQTLDFFTPVADDPFAYGQAAAVNSLNDVYAMGGTPLTALSIVCYPQKGDWDVLAEILAGGQSTMNAEGVVVLGGHSVDDAEMKFGYSVTGVVDPNRVITNSGAKPGDALILTKPIGTGAINTAVKRGVASPATEKAAVENMTRSSAAPSKAMVRLGANACTDITGFGLLGHAYEMAKGSDVTLNIDSKAVPLLPDVLELIAQGMLTRGDKNNRIYVDGTVNFAGDTSAEMQSALFDPQTAGGLLISLPAENVEKYLRDIPDAAVIGRVVENGQFLIEVN
ncbi:MAG TPA: selenide, water dikinase SelD [Pyrinomonadaceae bacterium]|nr:selenide, water dikinase SelD [Pyrinomonadaceae bacterium]